MDLTGFQRRLEEQGDLVVRRYQRERVLPRILEFAGVTINDVVNDPRAKIAVLRLFRIADACAYETLRSELREIAEQRWFVRENL